MLERRPSPWGQKRVAAATFLSALIARAVVQIALGGEAEPLRWEYDKIARNVAEGRGYFYDFLGARWETFGLPALPLLLAPLYAVFGPTGGLLAARLLVVVLSAATASIASLIGFRLFGRTEAVLAGSLVALHPGLLLYSAEIHELSLHTFALSGAALAYVSLSASPTRVTWRWASVTSALAVFVRPTYGAFILAALIMTARPHLWRRSIGVVIFIVLVALPWTIRTQMSLGEARPPLGPYNCVTLFMGNNANASGSTIAADGTGWWDAQPPALQARVQGRTEEEQGQIFCDEALSWVTADPLRAINWWATKFTWYWWASPQLGTLYPHAWVGVALGTWAVTVVFAAVGAFRIWGTNRRQLGVLLGLLASVSLAQSAAYVDGRHRWEVDWVALVLAAGGAVHIWQLLMNVLRDRSKASRLS